MDQDRRVSVLEILNQSNLGFQENPDDQDLADADQMLDNLTREQLQTILNRLRGQYVASFVQTDDTALNLEVYLINKRTKRIVKRLLIPKIISRESLETIQLGQLQGWGDAFIVKTGVPFANLAYLTLRRPGCLDNKVTYVNMISGRSRIIEFRDDQTTEDNILTHQSHNKFFLGALCKNESKLRRRREAIAQELGNIRYSIPWMHQGEYYYIVLYRHKRGLWVLDETMEPIHGFLAGFLSGEEGQYPDRLWHGLTGNILFFSPFKSELNYVLYYCDVNKMIERALESAKKAKSQGSLINRFKF